MNPDWGIKFQDRFHSGLSLLIFISSWTIVQFQLKAIQFAYSGAAPQHEKKHRQRRSLKKQRLSAKHSLYLNHNASGDTLNPLPLQMHSPQPQNEMTPKVCATLTYVLSFQLGKHACKSRELVFLFLSETIPIMHTLVTPCSPLN